MTELLMRVRPPRRFLMGGDARLWLLVIVLVLILVITVVNRRRR